jgi:adenylate cyclase
VRPAPARSFGRRDARLASGLVLFVYVATHLANHALGLVSLAAAEAGLRAGVVVWQSLPGTLLLYGAAAVHVALAFDAIFQRRTLRMPPAEVLRIALGLGMPLLLIGHVVATRVGFEQYGHAPIYERVVWSLWNSDSRGRQLALLAPGWIHGCLGLRFVLLRFAWYPRWRLWLFGAALLLPVLSALGFITMMREVAARAVDPALGAPVALPAHAERMALAAIRDTSVAIYLGAIGLVFGSRELRAWIERARRVAVRIAFPDRTVTVPRGWSVLEASRAFGLPHASACGGRARCSTCRVRVVEGPDALVAPDAEEAATLARIGAAEDVRLACRLRPAVDVTVVPLVSATAPHAAMHPSTSVTERDLVVLVARAVDVAGGPDQADAALLPDDRLFLLARFHETVGAAVERSGGVPVAAAPGEVRAVFGTRTTRQAAARGALEAVEALRPALARLAHRCERDLGRAPTFAIAAVAGAGVLGEVGWRDRASRVVVGDVADAADRAIDAITDDGAVIDPLVRAWAAGTATAA